MIRVRMPLDGRMPSQVLAAYNSPKDATLDDLADVILNTVDVGSVIKQREPRYGEDIRPCSADERNSQRVPPGYGPGRFIMVSYPTSLDLFEMVVIVDGEVS